MRYHTLFLVILLKSAIGFSQDVTVTIGHKGSIHSKILNENRQLIISPPEGYDTSDQKYPVLFLLDGSDINLINARLVTYTLRMKMIIVAILNIDRDRDMMPLSAPSYEVKNPGAEKFLLFLEKELIPHIDSNYRTNGQRTIRGASLSGLFVMYAFLAKPELFNNYIGTCAGWYADMEPYFSSLSDNSFKNKTQFQDRKLFVANSLSDPLDPKKEIHHAMVEFSKKVNAALGDRVHFKYATYENAGHVPYPGFYDGLKYILEER